MRIALTVVAAVLIAACGREGQAPSVKAPAGASERVVKLGFAAPLTGPQAHYEAK